MIDAITFGPVPSRRLGRSLGINNIPPKSCTYSCLYCQVGRTVNRQFELQPFYQPNDIFQAVNKQIIAAQASGETIDYLTLVPDGEPTLDTRLAETIEMLRAFNISIAVISNASLIWREEVRAVLHKADLVSLKVDTVDDVLWRRINQPHESLKLADILQGIQQFAAQYSGKLITETMLLAGINDRAEAVTAVADFLQKIQPHTAYIAAPTRPTAEPGIESPAEDVLLQTYEIFSKKLASVQYLTGYEGDDFAYGGDIERDLLSITSVHPMREGAVDAMLSRSGLGWDAIDALLQSHKLKRVEFSGETFYVRQLPVKQR